MGIAVQGGAVQFWDTHGASPKFGGDRESRTAQREGMIAWSDIEALVAELTGAAPTLPGQYPGLTMLYVKDFSIEPHGDEQTPTCGDVVAYTKAKCSISYGKLDYSPETLVTRKWGFSGEFMTLPASSVKWENGDAVENEEISAAKIIPMVEHSLTRQRCPSIPWTAIKACIGKVNSAALNDSIFTNVATHTLLYMGASIDWTLSTDGSEVWTLEHRFQERRVLDGADIRGWNHFWRPDTKTWQRLVNNAGGFIYETSADFDDLFSPEPP